MTPDDIKEKGLSADDVYDRATWRRMSSSTPHKSGIKMKEKKYKVFTQTSDSYFCFRTNLTPMAISGSATTNRTSALEPRHVGSPAYRRWGTDRSDI